MNSSPLAPPSRVPRRNLLRGAGVLLAFGLMALWLVFAWEIFTAAGTLPAPGGIMLPLFFCSLGLGAALAAVRGEGAIVALAGALALPISLLLLPFPGVTRGIGLLDLGLIAVGIALMRAHDPALDHAAADPDGGETAV